ncbi:hypothetical protein H5410_002477, partial [Solanum commersonii]
RVLLHPIVHEGPAILIFIVEEGHVTLNFIVQPRDDLQKKYFLGLSCVSETNGPFIDGQTTGIEPVHGGFTIHCLDPLGYIRPYPHRGNKASTSRSFLTKLQTKRGRAGSEGSFSRQRASCKLY